VDKIDIVNRRQSGARAGITRTNAASKPCISLQEIGSGTILHDGKGSLVVQKIAHVGHLPARDYESGKRCSNLMGTVHRQ
jgi:hypothetical protein